MPPNNQPSSQAAPVDGASLMAAAGSATAKPVTPKNATSTQAMLKFSEIRDNLMVMGDGSFRAVVRCQSINFDLMSTAEKEGVELSYQNFLNSLNFPIQILVRSKKVDVEPYLQQMIALRQAEDNMLLGVLMEDYINFIDRLSQEVNIMSKDFYVVVQYNPGGDINVNNAVERSKGFFAQIFAPPTQNVTKIDAATYQKAKDEMSNRLDTVMSGLFQVGIHCGQLTTKELGELLYNFYNPDTAIQEPLPDYSAVTGSLYVKKGQGVVPNVAGGING